MSFKEVHERMDKAQAALVDGRRATAVGELRAGMRRIQGMIKSVERAQDEEDLAQRELELADDKPLPPYREPRPVATVNTSTGVVMTPADIVETVHMAEGLHTLNEISGDKKVGDRLLAAAAAGRKDPLEFTGETDPFGLAAPMPPSETIPVGPEHATAPKKTRKKRVSDGLPTEAEVDAKESTGSLTDDLARIRQKRGEWASA